jgi:hypothetical protein
MESDGSCSAAAIAARRPPPPAPTIATSAWMTSTCRLPLTRCQRPRHRWPAAAEQCDTVWHCAELRSLADRAWPVPHAREAARGIGHPTRAVGSELLDQGPILQVLPGARRTCRDEKRFAQARRTSERKVSRSFSAGWLPSAGRSARLQQLCSAEIGSASNGPLARVCSAPVIVVDALTQRLRGRYVSASLNTAMLLSVSRMTGK